VNTLPCDSVQRLLSDFLAGDVASQEADGIDAHLADCASCRLEAGHLFQQDRALTELAARASIDELRGRVRAVLAGSTQPVAARVRARRYFRPSRLAWVGAGLAAALVLVAVVLRVGQSPDAPPRAVVARLEQVQGDVFILGSDTRTAAQNGQSLFAGEGLQVGDDGNAIVVYDDTSRLELAAGTTINWTGTEDAGKHVYLVEGALTADVAPGSTDHPLIVSTAHAEVIARLNRVSLVNALDSTRIESEKGTARVTRKSDGQTIEVGAGTFAIAALQPGKFASQRQAPRLTAARSSFLGHPGGALSLAYCEDGGLLASGGSTGAVLVWDAATGAVKQHWSDHGAAVRTVAFAANGGTLASAGDDRVIRFGDVASGESRATPKGAAGAVYAMRFAPHGKTLTSCGYDRRLKVWHTGTARLQSFTRLDQYRSDNDFPASMAFSPNGQQLAWGLKDNTARLWETATAKELHVLRGHEGAVTAAAFSADGQTLATGSRDRTARVWDTATGTALVMLSGHKHTVQAVAFQPRGRLLATGSADGTVKLWDLADGAERATLQGPGKPIQAVAFAPDGQSLATACLDGSVQVWDVPQVK